MRMVFGLMSLLAAVVIVALLARAQLKSATAVPSAAGATAGGPAATPALQSRELQRKFNEDAARALQEGVDRAASAAP